MYYDVKNREGVLRFRTPEEALEYVLDDMADVPLDEIEYPIAIYRYELLKIEDSQRDQLANKLVDDLCGYLEGYQWEDAEDCGESAMLEHAKRMVDAYRVSLYEAVGDPILFSREDCERLFSEWYKTEAEGNSKIYDHERNMKDLDKTFARAKEVVSSWPDDKQKRLRAYLHTPDTNGIINQQPNQPKRNKDN